LEPNKNSMIFFGLFPQYANIAGTQTHIHTTHMISRTALLRSARSENYAASAAGAMSRRCAVVVERVTTSPLVAVADDLSAASPALVHSLSVGVKWRNGVPTSP